MNEETRYRSRRFVMTVTCLIVNTALLVGGYIDALIYRDLQLGTVAVYIAGNGFQKFTDAKYANRNPD